MAAGSGCLVIETTGVASTDPTLIVFIHGDGSRGGASDYMFKYARTYGAENIISIGLIRPGYFVSDGHY